MPHVLLAEDDRDLGELQVTLLEALGYQVTLVTDGAQARDQLAAAPADFDVLVTDAHMPELTGLELTRWVRQHEQLAGLPVLLTSGSQADSEVAALLDQRTCFGAKPMGLETIASLLGKLLKRAPTASMRPLGREG